MDASDPDRISARTRGGLSWNLATTVVTNFMRIGLVAVLGRLLDSSEFGIVAAAISVMVLFYAIRDVGVGRAIVQRKDIDPAHLSTAFAVSTYLGIGLGLVMAATAPLVGALYRIPESVDILRALSLLFVLRGLAITSRMMLLREMRFRTTALIDQSAFLFGAITSLIAAFAGAGPWALVGGYLVEEAIATCLYLVKSPPPASLRIRGDKLRDLMQFGLAETMSQIAATLATYGDNFVVGNVLGARMLGFYTRAYDLIKLPATLFDKIAGNVLFPAFSRLQDEPERLGTGLRRAMFINALVLIPASAMLLIVAPETIRILLGPGWEETVLPFRILSVTMLARTSWKVGAWIGGAAGSIRGVALVNTLYMVMTIAGAALTVQWGIVGVAWSTAFAIAFAFVGTTYLAQKIARVSARALVAVHLPGLVIAVLVAAVAAPLAFMLRAASANAVVVFGAVVLVSGVLGVVALLVCLRRGRGEFAWLGSEVNRILKRRISSSS